MIGEARVAGPLGRRGGTPFTRFAAVGCAGFLVDATVLLGLVHVAGASPVGGRLASFGIAVIATFALNRRWTFGDRDRRRLGPAFAAYLAVQGLGFACNLGVYVLLHLVLPAPFDAPLPCLALASGAALLVNYLGASRLVFRPVTRSHAG